MSKNKPTYWTNPKTGEVKVLLNPALKGRKYSAEMKKNVRYTNDGKLKVYENGKPMRLTKQGKAYRAGYLQARKDSANCYKAKLRRSNGILDAPNLH